MSRGKTIQIYLTDGSQQNSDSRVDHEHFKRFDSEETTERSIE